MVKNNDHIEESPVNQDKRKSHKNKLILVIIAIVIGLFISQKIYVLKITSSTMLSTFKSGQFVVAVKKKEIKQGDLIAFWHGNKLLVKRVIAGPGDKVEIDMKGNVSVNDKKINEPYINKKVLGKSELEEGAFKGAYSNSNTQKSFAKRPFYLSSITRSEQTPGNCQSCHDDRDHAHQFDRTLLQ